MPIRWSSILSVPSYQLASHVDVLEDPGTKLTIQDVASVSYASQFHAPAQPISTGADSALNFGYSASAFWLRLTIDTPQAATGRMLLEVAFPSLDHVDFYTPATNGWQLQAAGDLVPFARRPIPHRNFVFPVSWLAARKRSICACSRTAR